MIPEQRIRELAAYASDPCADVQHWLAAELLAARAELLSMGVKCGLLEAARDEARAEAERVTERRDTLLAAVMDGTAEFRDWKECVADQIEGQENEVCRDHNRMLAALRTLRRKAKHVQNGPRAVVEAGSLPAHLERAEQPKPACPQCDGTRTVEKCDWPGEHANRYQEQCGECAEQPKPVEPTQEPWQFDYGGPAFPEQPKPAGGA